MGSGDENGGARKNGRVKSFGQDSPQEFPGPSFFRVTHDGLNEEGNTRSLSFELPSPGEHTGPQAPWETCAVRREHLSKQEPSVNQAYCLVSNREGLGTSL